MIKASPNRLYCWLFGNYFELILRRHFRKIIILSDYTPDDRPVLLIPNHFSWWDGFIAWHLNETIFRKKFHLMMLEAELGKRRFFSKLGAFSIQPGRKQIIESLDYAAEILSKPGNLLVLYPQGKLYSQHSPEIQFLQGIDRIIAKSDKPAIIMAVALTEYYTHKRPSLVIHLKEFESAEKFNLAQLQEAYNLMLNNCIKKHDNLFRQ